MNTIQVFAAAALLAVGVASSVAADQSVNLDGSVNRTAKGPTLAASASRALNAAAVPSTQIGQRDVKAAADADIQKRQAQPRLKAERQNLLGPEAARVQAQQQNPATLDHDIAVGDIDHTQQVTDVKVYLKK